MIKSGCQTFYMTETLSILAAAIVCSVNNFLWVIVKEPKIYRVDKWSVALCFPACIQINRPITTFCLVLKRCSVDECLTVNSIWSTMENAVHCGSFPEKNDSARLDGSTYATEEKYRKASVDFARKVSAQKQLVEAMGHQTHIDHNIELVGKLLFGIDKGGFAESTLLILLMCIFIAFQVRRGGQEERIRWD